MHTPEPSPRRPAPRLLISAGPTQEPIDAVRFIGNRSSGKLGIRLAEQAAHRGWKVTLALGPVCSEPQDPSVEVVRFRTTADLEAILTERWPHADVLVMAAAVADYRPKADPEDLKSKKRRSAEGMTIDLEATPDLLAACAATRRPGQRLVGFALEPREQMARSAIEKLGRKGVDVIVANPLETMDAPNIEATAYSTPDLGFNNGRATGGPITKDRFADWLLDLIAQLPDSAQTNSPSEPPHARS